MLTKSDKKFLTKTFLTKEDAKGVATSKDLGGLEQRLGKKFKSVDTKLNAIKKSLELAIDVFDRQGLYHHKRLAALEKNAGFAKQPLSPTVN